MQVAQNAALRVRDHQRHRFLRGKNGLADLFQQRVQTRALRGRNSNGARHVWHVFKLIDLVQHVDHRFVARSQFAEHAHDDLSLLHKIVV